MYGQSTLRDTIQVMCTACMEDDALAHRGELDSEYSEFPEYTMMYPRRGYRFTANPKLDGLMFRSAAGPTSKPSHAYDRKLQDGG
jgi:hypothetical protein